MPPSFDEKGRSSAKGRLFLISEGQKKHKGIVPIFRVHSGKVWHTSLLDMTSYLSESLPKEYTPVLGSLNAELIDYANALGKPILNPDECIATVKGYNQITNASTPKVHPSVANNTPANNTATVQSNFCRKCGTRVQADSSFCHKCGTKIIK